MIDEYAGRMGDDFIDSLHRLTEDVKATQQTDPHRLSGLVSTHRLVDASADYLELSEPYTDVGAFSDRVLKDV